MKELTYKIDHDDLVYCFKGVTTKNNFNDGSGIKRFRKIQYGEMNLEDAKLLQNTFKSSLNELNQKCIRKY